MGNIIIVVDSTKLKDAIANLTDYNDRYGVSEQQVEKALTQWLQNFVPDIAAEADYYIAMMGQEGAFDKILAEFNR